MKTAPTLDFPGERRPLTVMGWIEAIDLPDLGLVSLKSKLDTGARTSALHVEDLEAFRRDGADWVRFHPAGDPRVVEAPLIERREIRNTGGIPEMRPVIRTRARFGSRTWAIELSLTDRTNMSFAMIVGRAALKNHAVVVHTRRAYLVTDKPDTEVTRTSEGTK